MRSRSALVSRATLGRIRFWNLLAIVGEELERMSAILDSADDVTVHTVTIIARTAGRNEIAILVRLAVQLAAEWAQRMRCGRQGDVGGVAVVTNRATNSFLQDGRTSFDLQDAFLHDASRVIADAIAKVARIIRIGRHLSSITVE